MSQKPESASAKEDDHGLEEKIQDYHRRGGPHGGHDAKSVEADIASTAISANDDLKKGRPPTDPTPRD